MSWKTIERAVAKAMDESCFEIQLAFEIQGTVHQRLRIINPDYDEDRIIAELDDGTLATSTWHDGPETKTQIEIIATGEPIADILSQEIEGEHFDFR